MRVLFVTDLFWPLIGGIEVWSARVVLDGRTGRLVAPDDRDALTAPIGEILVDPDRARRMGAAGRRHATERFSLEGMMDAYEGLHERLANRRVDARA